MKLSILLKIVVILIMGCYLNKKTYDPIEYFSKKPQVEICKKKDDIEIKIKKEKDDKG